MKTSGRSLLRDPELVEMLLREPELLALAEALVATKGRARASEKLRKTRRRFRILAVALPVAAASVALLLVSPWQGNRSFVEKAAAAIGNQPVLHVASSQALPPDQTVNNIKTGQTTSRELVTEVWFDRGLGLKKTVSRIDEESLDELLETKSGSWTTAGRVYTCAWVSAHPVEATSLGVSCNADGSNPPNGRLLAETSPVLDPALAGFVDHYRSVLASGEAKQVGTGTFDGHKVVWLEFIANGLREKVAVDTDSYKPIVIVPQGNNAPLRILRAETVARSETFFTRPKKTDVPTGGRLSAGAAISLVQAQSLLGRPALWLGPSWNGLTLVAVTRHELTTAYGAGQSQRRAIVLKFSYAASRPDGTEGQLGRVDIFETNQCAVSVGWTCTAYDPRVDGTMQSRGRISLLLTGGLHLSVWNFSSDSQSPLALARDVRPVTGVTTP